MNDIITIIADLPLDAMTASDWQRVRAVLEDGEALAALGITDDDQEAVEDAHAKAIAAISNMTMKHYHLSIKMWRDRTYGNSYGSARLYGDGQLLHVVPFGYGQEATIEYHAAESLGSGGSLHRFVHDGGHTLTRDVAWVTKKEAKSHGTA